MERNQKLIFAIGGGIALIAIAAGVWLVFKNPTAPPPPPEPPSSYITTQSAEDIARETARAWQADAKLVWMSTEGGGVTEQGASNIHRFRFASASAPDILLEVAMSGRSVLSTQEIAGTATEIGEIPEKGFISEAEAIAQMRQIPGYENEKIMSIELVYGPGTDTWYWGIYTETKGAVSINAERQ